MEFREKIYERVPRDEWGYPIHRRRESESDPREYNDDESGGELKRNCVKAITAAAKLEAFIDRHGDRLDGVLVGVSKSLIKLTVPLFDILKGLGVEPPIIVKTESLQEQIARSERVFESYPAPAIGRID
jgi:hypothetical protein